jgi:hypothetical protein
MDRQPQLHTKRGIIRIPLHENGPLAKVPEARLNDGIEEG